MNDHFNQWWNRFAMRFPPSRSLELERKIAREAFMAGCDAATEELLLKKIIFTTDENGCISGFKKE